jgi:hypothetical protein
MENNVLSWGVALEKGYEPRLYPYTLEHIPIGEYEAILDFKIWAKKAVGISCYFTERDTGAKFQLTVFRRQGDKLYKLDKSDIDFKTCDTDSGYKITVVINSKGNVSFKNIKYCIY